jgi:hypothetical protein
LPEGGTVRKLRCIAHHSRYDAIATIVADVSTEIPLAPSTGGRAQHVGVDQSGSVDQSGTQPSAVRWNSGQRMQERTSFG